MYRILLKISLLFFVSPVPNVLSQVSPWYAKKYELLTDSSFNTIKKDLDSLIVQNSISEHRLDAKNRVHIVSILKRIKDIRWQENKPQITKYISDFIITILSGKSYLSPKNIEETFLGKYKGMNLGKDPVFYPEMALDALLKIDMSKGAVTMNYIWENYLNTSNPGYLEIRINILKLLYREHYSNKSIHEFMNNHISLDKSSPKEVEILTQYNYEYNASLTFSQTHTWNYMWQNSNILTEQLTSWNNKGVWSKNIHVMSKLYDNINLGVIFNEIEQTNDISKQYIFLYNLICTTQIKLAKNQKISKDDLDKIKFLVTNFYSENKKLFKDPVNQNPDFLQPLYNSFLREIEK